MDGPILDANGWAVNAKAKVNVPFGTSLTGIAKLPPGSTIEASDKFAESSSMLPKLIMFLFLLWWSWAFLNDSQGRLHTWTDGKAGSPPSKEVIEQRAALAKVADDKAKKEDDDKKAKKVADDAAKAVVSITTNAPATK